MTVAPAMSLRDGRLDLERELLAAICTAGAPALLALRRTPWCPDWMTGLQRLAVEAAEAVALRGEAAGPVGADAIAAEVRTHAGDELADGVRGVVEDALEAHGGEVAPGAIEALADALADAVAAGGEEPPEPSRIIPVRITMDDVRAPPRDVCLLGPALPAGKATVVYGPTAVGKSAALGQIALHVAAGSASLWGLPLLPGGGPVLIYTAEDTLDDWRRRAAAVANAGGIDMARAVERLWIIDQSEGLARLSETVTIRTIGPGESVSRRETRPTAEQDRLIAAAREVGAVLVIVETASRLVDDEDNPSLAGLVSALGRIGRESSASVTVSHHATKAASRDGDSAIESARGGGALTANARCVLSLFAANEAEAGAYRDRHALEDLVVLAQAKGTSSTRRMSSVVLVRQGTPYGAVLARPEDIAQSPASPEEAAATAARLDAERQREWEHLRRLYEVVERALPLRPSVSPSWLRDQRHVEIGVPMRTVEGLVGLALDRGVLVVRTRSTRGVTLGLGADPRQPIDCPSLPESPPEDA